MSAVCEASPSSPRASHVRLAPVRPVYSWWSPSSRSSQAAAPPARLHLDRWIEDLGSDDDEVWKKAQDSLWAAGDRRCRPCGGAKRPTPRSCCAPTVLVSRLEWGIYPDTPAAIVTEIETLPRRRRGQDKRRRHAADQARRRRASRRCGGCSSRRPTTTARRAIADQLKTLIRPQVRDLIVRGEFDDAERTLEMAPPAASRRRWITARSWC